MRLPFGRRTGATGCKPSFVGAARSPRAARTIIHLGAPLPTSSSDLPGDSSGPLSRRRLEVSRATPPPYAVLLRMGFTLPPPLPGVRWALTPPFHPCPPTARRSGRFVFCGTLLGVTPTGRYPASCPAKLGLSSRATRGWHQRPSAPVARPLCITPTAKVSGHE